MLTGLLASARELRNPLTVGYFALFSLWLVTGEELAEAARSDPLGRRLLAALDSVGDGARIALVTFAAAIIGSVLWNIGIARLVRLLSVLARHPDWDSYIEEAKEEVRSYEQYKVVTYKGRSGNGNSSPFDADHTVPSPRWGVYLHERVDERERKAAEMSFRVTLAVALVPLVIALGLEGGGQWWWSVAAVPFVWVDVMLLKYTTLRTVRRFELEDLEPKLERARSALKDAERPGDYSGYPEQRRESAEAERLARAKRLRGIVDELDSRKRELDDEAARRLPRLFAFLEGDPSK